MFDKDYDYQLKLILIGDSATGKSTLVKYFIDGQFSQYIDVTTSVDLYAKVIKLQDGTKIKLIVGDTAGQERFRALTTSYYRKSVGAIMVFDVFDRSSFSHVPHWLNEIRIHMTELSNPVIALAACKIDLLESNQAGRQVSSEEAKNYAKANDLHYFETSAKTGLNIEKMFMHVAEEVYNRIKTSNYKVNTDFDGIKVGYEGPKGVDAPPPPPSSGGCC